jgi:hypothetical protein
MHTSSSTASGNCWRKMQGYLKKAGGIQTVHEGTVAW